MDDADILKNDNWTTDNIDDWLADDSDILNSDN